MIQQKFNQEMFSKPGSSRREERLTSQVKNTMMHLNGQNFRLAAKNGCNSKAPGLHLSATHGGEAVGRLTPALPTQEGTVRLDLLLRKSPVPDLEKEGVNLPLRRPLKLAPLELPEEVREAQMQKIKGIQQEAKAASCTLDAAGNEPCPRKVKACVRKRLAKPPACPSAATEPAQGQQQQRAPRAQLIRARPVEHNGDRQLEDVVCRGAPVPMCNKPAPPSQSPSAKTLATRGGESPCQNPSTLQQETGRRRLRLRRVQHLEEDQGKSNTSTGGLSADEGKLAQGLQGRGQRAERALREASRMLENASKRNPAQQHPGNMEVSGRAIRKVAVSNLQDGVL